MDCQKLTAVSLFAGMQPEEIEAVLNCFGVQSAQYERGEVIFAAGQKIRQIGIVLSGKVMVERDDYWGNRSILAAVGEGEVFAETYACLSQARSDVNVVAAQHSEVLLLQVQKVLTLCPTACPFHRRILQNLLEVTANKNRLLAVNGDDKNRQLSLKLEILSRKTTREKLLAYLSYQAGMAPGGGKAAFVIPFNRQQLADYLSVDRSAMTVELGKLKKEGLIDFDRNTFRIC